jgi:hypothetical protein
MSAFDVIGDSEFSTHSSKYEIDGFLQKPISIKELNSIINSYMTKTKIFSAAEKYSSDCL